MTQKLIFQASTKSLAGLVLVGALLFIPLSGIIIPKHSLLSTFFRTFAPEFLN